MDIASYFAELGEQARLAAAKVSMATTEQKNRGLLLIAKEILARQPEILAANEKDLIAGREKGLDDALLDRLALDENRIHAMVEGLEQVATLADPVGAISQLAYRPSGIQLGKMRVPLGVIGIIYESRPNVTIDAAALCLKSGNATILRGGSESIHSNQALANCISIGLKQAELPEAAVQVVETTDREVVAEMIRHPKWVDVIVPRGGKGLIERISADARVPVIKHLDGVCHQYIDDEADPNKAFDIVINSKTHRYGVCNAMESLLVNETVAELILPRIAKELEEKSVEIRGCEKTREWISALSATESDWSEEYLAPILSVKVVSSMEEAIEHINKYGSHHTDGIVTENYSKSRVFLRAVDSSSVMVNASTRFADGFEYGLGAEIGISTDKIHARGPVGLEGLTSEKYIVLGDGQIRK